MTNKVVMGYKIEPYADLQDADLRGADLDFSCFPLWCGSFNAKFDDRLVKQLLAHIARIDKTNLPDDVKQFINKIPKKYVNDICKRHDIEEL